MAYLPRASSGRVWGVALAGVLFLTPSAAIASCLWTDVASPTVGTLQNELRGVAALSSTNVWAVGYYTSGSITRNLIEHWNGTYWAIVPSPNVGSYSNQLARVVAASPTSIWAVGFWTNSAGTTFTLVEHFNGVGWSVVPSPNVGTLSNEFKSAAVVAGTAYVWAVGDWKDSTGTNHTLTERWNGAGWQVITSPNASAHSNHLRAVVALATNNVWAVGKFKNGSGVYNTLVLHWNGLSWAVVPSPNVGTSTNDLKAVTGVPGSGYLWAVGFYMSGAAERTLTERWNGASWALVVSPNVGFYTNELRGIAATSATNVWAVGLYNNSVGSSFTLTEHFNGLGWSAIASPNLSAAQNSLTTDAFVPMTTLLWAVGQYAKYRTLTQLFHC